MGLRGPWEASQLLPRPEKPGFLSNPNLSLFNLSLFNLSLFNLNLFSQQCKDSSRGQQSAQV